MQLNGKAAVRTIKQGEQDSGSNPDVPIGFTMNTLLHNPLGKSLKK